MRPSLLLAASLVLAAPAIAEPPLNAGDPPQAPAGSGASSAVSNLQSTLASLNLMTNAIGPAESDSKSRIAQMQAYLAQANLTDAFKAFTPVASPKPLSFDQAYQAALQQQQLHPIQPGSMSDDLSTLANEVQATTTMVQTAWNRLNANLATVDAMTQFLAKNDKMDDYLKWAPSYQEAQKKAQAEQLASARAAADKQAQDQEVARNQALRQLQQRWDQMHYVSTGTDYNYVFSQGVPPGSQTGNTQFSQGVAPGSQTGYYGGSYWNGYADPYSEIYWDNTHLNFSAFGPAGGWNGASNYWGGYYPTYNSPNVANWNRIRNQAYHPAGVNAAGGDGGAGGAGGAGGDAGRAGGGRGR